MPITICNPTGDGQIADYISAKITLPDSGQSILVSGLVRKVGNPQATIIGSPLTGPTIPGSGTTAYIIQVNYLTGVASIKTLANGTPTPDANNMVVFTGTATAGDASLLLAAVPPSTPDSW